MASPYYAQPKAKLPHSGSAGGAVPARVRVQGRRTDSGGHTDGGALLRPQHHKRTHLLGHVRHLRCSTPQNNLAWGRRDRMYLPAPSHLLSLIVKVCSRGLNSSAPSGCGMKILADGEAGSPDS